MGPPAPLFFLLNKNLISKIIVTGYLRTFCFHKNYIVFL